MRKHLLLSLVLTFVACSNIEGASQRVDGVSTCATVAAPWLGLESAPALADVNTAAAVDEPLLRAVTINLHSGMGQVKGLWSARATVQRRLDEMATAIAADAAEPVDVVALNEVDFSARRSGGIDQAQYLAEALRQKTGATYQVVHGRTRARMFPTFDGSFGNAVLVRHAIAETKTCLFDDLEACGVADAPAGMPALRADGLVQRALREGRGVIKLTLDFHGRALDVIVTHLEAVALPEREAQASHLLRRLVDPARTTLVLGDINAVPTNMTRARRFFGNDRTHDILTSGSLADARVLYDSRLGRDDFSVWATYPAVAPLLALDTAFASLDLFPHELRVMDMLDTDHRGFAVTYRLTRDAGTIAAQRARHDAIRQRQLTHILSCGNGATPSATLDWLRAGTQFFGLPGGEAVVVPRAVSAL